MRVVFLKRFDKSYLQLTVKEQQAIDKAIEKFLDTPRSLSLRIMKIEGQDKIFEMSANMDLRITFHYEKPETVIFRNCGHHDTTLKKP